MVKLIKKRNGQIVTFQIQKIEAAIEAAMDASGEGGADGARLAASLVYKTLSASFEGMLIPDVETIQDIVIEELKSSGYSRTAQRYAAYRENQSNKRESLRKIGRQNFDRKLFIKITDDSGTRDIPVDEIISELSVLSHGLSEVDVRAIFDSAIDLLPANPSGLDLNEALIHGARIRIEFHPHYSLFATRILFSKLYGQILSRSPGEPILEPETKTAKNFVEKYRRGFITFLERGIGEELIHPDLLSEFDLEPIMEALTPDRDLLFDYRGAKTLSDRYLLRARGRDGAIFELPQYFWMRVAMGLALAETDEEKTGRSLEFYNLFSRLDFVPSTPTLFNAGTLHPQLSSCFTTTVEDSLNGIFETFSDSAALSKFAGGIGADWTEVRSMGSPIRGTNGKSQGIIPFLKIYNDIAVAVNQGGKRKGALAAYLEIWHADVEQFVEAKKNTGDERRRLHDIHTALWIPDLFMKRMREKGSWTLFSPSDVPDLHSLYGKAFERRYEECELLNLPSARIVSAEGLWRKVLTMLFETGHPWITFKDPCNIRSPQDHVGVVKGSNLCTEITLNSSKEETAVCNLGSLNLSHFVDADGIRDGALREAVRTAVRLLDNVIDVNLYPTEAAKRSNLRHRAVGLGIMGYQEALYRMRIPFASEENLNFADLSMEKISYYAIEASSDLAKERGIYASYQGSKWDRGIFPLDTLDLLEAERGEKIPVPRISTMDWEALKGKVKRNGMRNSNLMAIAPTATISNISGTTPSIEPAFRNMYVKENVDGSFIVVNSHLMEELTRLGLWNDRVIQKIKFHNGSIEEIAEIPDDVRRLFQTAFDIDPAFVIEAAARRGKWIDQSASINLFVGTTSGRILSDLYTLAYSLGLKTTYYLRSQSASSVQKSSIEESVLSENRPSDLNGRGKEAIVAIMKYDPVSTSGELCKLNDPDCEVCQ